MKNSSALIIFVAINHLILMGCASHFPKDHLQPDECLERLEKQIEGKPVQTYLDTLDGQKVHLSEFFQRCLMNSPACSLPDKFYHWNNEVKLIDSETPHGSVLHKIRIYHNYLSTCRPDLVDIKKTHGDIAEFYNENGALMGLAVYAGDGLYCPLPYSKNRGIGQDIHFYMTNAHILPSHSQDPGTISIEKEQISTELLLIQPHTRR